MKRRWLVTGGITIAALIAGSLLLLNQPEGVPAIQVAREDVIATLTVTGEVQADRSVDFRPPVSAQIVSISVDEGDFFNPGQLLVQLDSSEPQADVAEARARAAQASASYANVLQGTRPEQIAQLRARLAESNRRIQQAQAALTQAQARREEAEHNAQRFDELFRDEFVSEQEYESAQLQAEVTRRDVERAQADLAAIRTQQEQAQAALDEAVNGPTTPELREAQQAAQAAQAATERARARLEDYRIVSTMRGIVTQRLQDPGDLATPSQPVLRAINPDTLEIICSVEESDLAKVQVGDAAYVVMDAASDISIPARITRVGSRVNPENGAVEVRAVLSGDAWKKLAGVRLMPGMTADVNIITERLRNAIVLPAAAVQFQDGKAFVYRFANNKLVLTPIQAKRISMENYRVLSGLKIGDWIAATASEKLRTQKRVRPIAQEPVEAPPKPPGGMATP